MKPLGLTREIERRPERAGCGPRWARWSARSAISASLPEAAERETAALFGHAVGLLLLVHTGRMRLFRLDGRELYGRLRRPSGRAAGHGAGGRTVASAIVTPEQRPARPIWANPMLPEAFRGLTSTIGRGRPADRCAQY